MAKKKIKRKQLLKEPDEFLSFSARMLQWINRHRDRLLWGAAAVLFIAVAVSGWAYYQNVRENNAVNAFGKIMAAYRQIGEDPASDAQAVRVKKRLAAFVEKYSDTASGKMGRVLFAHLCFRTGDMEEAIAAYRRALKDYEDHPLIRNVLLSSAGHAYLKNQQPGEAARYFERIASSDVPVSKAEALFILAHFSEKKGNYGARAEALKKILSDFPDSLHAVLAKEALGETGGAQ
jgi:predicted negative regulator of RcsB-dependent stress response